MPFCVRFVSAVVGGASEGRWGEEPPKLSAVDESRQRCRVAVMTCHYAASGERRFSRRSDPCIRPHLEPIAVALRLARKISLDSADDFLSREFVNFITNRIALASRFDDLQVFTAVESIRGETDCIEQS